MHKKILHIVAIVVGILGCTVDLTGGTECYRCDSLKDTGCEEDYIVNDTLVQCGQHSSYWRGDQNVNREITVINSAPRTCIKEVTIFLNPPKYDPDNRFNRPFVRRDCGFTIQQGYRSGRDLIDDCEEIEVTIQGVQGIKRTCFCSTDRCNSAFSIRSTWVTPALVGILLLQLSAFIL